MPTSSVRSRQTNSDEEVLDDGPTRPTASKAEDAKGAPNEATFYNSPLGLSLNFYCPTFPV